MIQEILYTIYGVIGICYIALWILMWFHKQNQLKVDKYYIEIAKIDLAMKIKQKIGSK